jgi:serine/threonine protein kinase
MTLRQMINHYKLKHKFIPRIVLKLFAYQLFRGMAFLHEQNICHRNLSPDNILVSHSTLQLKICDFSSAKFMQRGEVFENL